jgi:hypothetical protein
LEGRSSAEESSGMPLVRLALVLAVLAASAAPTALGARALPQIELDGVVAERPVRDAVLDDLQRAAPSRVEIFPDAHGHRITIGTDIPDLDLSWYAAVLQQTLHGVEIEQVLVEVVPWAAIEAVCGAPGAVGCYTPSQRRIVVTDHDPSGTDELIHTIVHEYGHHVDSQLENLGHLDWRCLARDGSRNWWWFRVPRRFACTGRAWDLLIAELYAEDYAVANGVRTWQLATIGPPAASDIGRLRYDFRTRFVPRTVRGARFVRRHRRVVWNVSVKHWTRLAAVVRGPSGADLDLYLYRRGRARPLRRSERRGSLERIVHEIRPGRYQVVVRAARAGGRAAIRVRLD